MRRSLPVNRQCSRGLGRFPNKQEIAFVLQMHCLPELSGIPDKLCYQEIRLIRKRPVYSLFQAVSIEKIPDKFCEKQMRFWR